MIKRRSARPGLEEETRKKLDQLFGIDWEEFYRQAKMPPLKAPKQLRGEVRRVARDVSLGEEQVFRERLLKLRDFVPDPAKRAGILRAYVTEYREKATPLVRKFPIVAIPEAKAHVDRTTKLFMSEVAFALKESKRQRPKREETIQSTVFPVAVRPVKEEPNVNATIGRLLGNSYFRGALRSIKKNEGLMDSLEKLLKSPRFLERRELDDLARISPEVRRLLAELRSKIRH